MQELQGLVKLLAQCYVLIIAGQQLQQRLLSSEGWLEIQLFQLNILLPQAVHILEEMHPVKMRGKTMKWLKVQMGCSQSPLSTFQEKLLLHKVDPEVNGIDYMMGSHGGIHLPQQMLDGTVMYHMLTRINSSLIGTSSI